MTKYGLKLDVQVPEDYVFGAGQIPYEPIVLDGDWTQWLVAKEFQNLNGVEPYACVIFTILNIVEILYLKKYGIERNWSDRFLASIVNTRGQGCSPKVACDFLRKIGVVPQSVWPFDETIDTEDKFFASIPQELYAIANEFNDELDFMYDFVPSDPEYISAALQCCPPLMSVPAWFLKENSLYYRPQGMQDNHATTLFMERKGEFRRVFDSYDSPHIKDVEWDCMPMQVMRFWINKKEKVEPKPVPKVSWWERIISFIKRWI